MDCVRHKIDPSFKFSSTDLFFCCPSSIALIIVCAVFPCKLISNFF